MNIIFYAFLTKVIARHNHGLVLISKIITAIIKIINFYHDFEVNQCHLLQNVH